MITDYVRILKVNMKTLIYECTCYTNLHVEDDTLIRTGIRSDAIPIILSEFETFDTEIWLKYLY